MRYALCATVCVTLLGLSLPAAAGGWGGRYGVSSHHEDETSATWSDREEQTRFDCRACARVEGLVLPSSFFEGDEGVGPFPDFPASGGGGGIAASGQAEAIAFASARASVRISIHGHGGHHGGGGCGCGGKK